MLATEKKASLARPVPELPVADVERAQQHYRDVFGLDIAWLEPDKGIGAVTGPDVTLFFRRREQPFEPTIHWVFAADIEAMHHQLQSTGANIVDPLEKKPWGIRQFTIQDPDGNLFHIHNG